MAAIGADGLPLGNCVTDPDSWTAAIDRPDEDTSEAAKALCRSCPRRWACAREAWEAPRAEGLWAGVVIPESGRGRTFALKQLRSLADRNGFPVRARRVYLESA